MEIWILSSFSSNLFDNCIIELYSPSSSHRIMRTPSFYSFLVFPLILCFASLPAYH
ncbi:unnamed protein product [Linum tenue]|uniref:Uncharacterized protein n=1 Tax=Linum tenue TaxID=586396 RepID=A0AAV0K324_9ROSI|nr:unnamed protein product [Linum tenue]